MKNFALVNARTLEDAVSSLGTEWNEAVVMSGGTDLLGEMKRYIQSPEKVVNLKTVNGLEGTRSEGENVVIGAETKIADVASENTIREHLTALSMAAESVASPQIRNMGTISGNICQRPRCWYFRDTEVPCMKKGGIRCYSVAGVNTYHAIYGGGPCHIVHPSDTAVALMAFDTTLTIVDKYGTKDVPFDEFFVLPEDDASRENILKPYQVISRISVKAPDDNVKSTFIKVQEREAWDFAVASVAVSMRLEGNTCREAKVVLGAAAPVPWRSEAAENALVGKNITESVAEAAGEASVADSTPMTDNKYKTELFSNIVKRAVLELV
ncbi:MAG: xanthine dehydrogenase family protein subunit M [bacterium]|nr:xanthine dehydrogenase family protein subunit M [bacterium]